MTTGSHTHGHQVTVNGKLYSTNTKAHSHTEAAIEKRVAALEARVAALEAVEPPPVEPPPVEPPPEPPPVEPPGTYPPDTALSVIALPPIPPLPAKGSSVVTVAGTHTTRITDAGIRHAYSKTQPWNADGTLLLCGNRLIDGRTYAPVKTLGTLPGYANWSPTDPDYLYGTWDGDPNLWRLNVLTGALTSVRNFGRNISLGNGEGGISDDGKVALISGTDIGAFSVSDGSGAWFAAGGSPDNATMSRDGRYIGVDFGSRADGSGAGKGCCSFTLAGAGRQLATVSRHGDTAVAVNGAQVWVNVANGVEMYDLATGAKTALLPTPNAYSFGHVSGRGRAGWAYLSVYDTATVSGQRGNDQLVAVKLDGSQTVQVYGLAMRRGSSYESQPQAVANRDGTLVLFTSDWGSTSYYDFVCGV